jgi:predicted P-loop ATPase/GTPase
LDELSQKVKEEKLHSEHLEQELSNANSVIDSLHEQIKHLENIVITEQERNKQSSVSRIFTITINKKNVLIFQ